MKSRGNPGQVALKTEYRRACSRNEGTRLSSDPIQNTKDVTLEELYHPFAWEATHSSY